MMRFICQKCLRLWDAGQVSHTVSCPYCGGGLNENAR
jgi:DNA-directed RNA polymerase subunit RPC12/RpoP